MGTGDAEGLFAHVSAVPDTKGTPNLPSEASFCTNQLKAKVPTAGQMTGQTSCIPVKPNLL